jgi:hypothetical protein
MQLPTMRPRAEGFVRGCAALLITLAELLSPGLSLAVSDKATAVAVADFDNLDTSGEAADRTAQHAIRVQDFAGLLRDDLVGVGNYQVVRLQCGQPTCSAATLAPTRSLRRRGAPAHACSSMAVFTR